MKFVKSCAKFLIIVITVILVVITLVLEKFLKIVQFPFKFVTLFLLNMSLKIVQNKRKYFEIPNDYNPTDVMKILIEIDKDIVFIKNLKKDLKIWN